MLDGQERKLVSCIPKSFRSFNSQECFLPPSKSPWGRPTVWTESALCREFLFINDFWVAKGWGEPMSSDNITDNGEWELASDWSMEHRAALWLASTISNNWWLLWSELWNAASIVRASGGQWCGGNGDSYPGQIFGPVWSISDICNIDPGQWATRTSEPPPRTEHDFWQMELLLSQLSHVWSRVSATTIK